MHETNNRLEKLKLFFIIFLPIFITQIGLSLINFFDTMMSGQVSPTDLAGVAIAGSLWSPVYAGLNGILLAVTPIVSQLLGARKKEEIRISVFQAIYVAIAITIFIFIFGFLFLHRILDLMNLEKRVRDVAYDYLFAISFGILPLFIFNVLRCFIDSLGKTKISMLITLLTVPINASLNYLFIFGKFGFPKLGGVGAGVASALTYWIICMITVYIIHSKQPFRNYHIFKNIQSIHFHKWREIIRIGVPIGFSIFFESSIFSAVTILMSEFDTKTIAAYQAALNFTNILYMFPLSISMALTIVVAFEVGAKRMKDAKEYSWIGVALALGMAAVNASVLYIFRLPIAFLYTKEDDVATLISSFLLFALCFQFSDGVQASVQGALRGYKDVNITLIATLCAYWLIGLPIGYCLAKFTDFGPYGYWIGLIFGLTTSAIGLASRLLFIQRKSTKGRLKI